MISNLDKVIIEDRIEALVDSLEYATTQLVSASNKVNTLKQQIKELQELL